MRKEGWELSYSNFLKERRSMEYAKGTNDCMAFMAHGVREITGVHYWEQFEGYRTDEEAITLMTENGGIVGLISMKLGEGHRNPLQAKRGDVVVFKYPELISGLVDDSGQNIAAVTDKGWIKVPLRKAWRIWSID